jgi:cell division protein FtsI (penicillin-binding protein 3)
VGANAANAASPANVSSAPVASAQAWGGGGSRILNLLPAKVVAAFEASGGTNSVIPNAGSDASASLRAAVVAPPVQSRANGSVVVVAGDGLRKVVETATGVGLRVEPVGSGIAREQVPEAGTRVPLGTEIVVRFER